MATERQTGAQQDSAVSDANLTGKEYHACKRTSTGVALCTTGDFCDGVITEGKAAGLHTSFATGNQLKALAGEQINVGQKVTPDGNAAFRVADTADDEVFGTAISAASEAGVLFTIEVDRGTVIAA